jgi:hypothetical protein
LLGGVAVLMVVVIAFSGRSNPKSQPLQPSAPNAPMAPNSDRLEQYKRQLEGDTQRLLEEQKRLAGTKKAWDATTGQAVDSPGSGGPGANFSRTPSDNYQPNAEPPRNPFREEMEKRQFLSRFSSNVAKSNGQSTDALRTHARRDKFAAQPCRFWTPPPRQAVVPFQKFATSPWESVCVRHTSGQV